MDLQTVFTSKFGIDLAMTLGRILPLPAGHLVANTAARIIAWRKQNPQVRAVRANQWVVSKKTKDASNLDQAVRDVYKHSARCIYDMYHYYKNLPLLQKKVKFSDRAIDLIERSQAHKEGAVLVGPHLSNFDLCLQALALQGLHVLVLSHPQPPSGYQVQNKLRTQKGMEAVPISIAALRQASDRLRSGGMVLTGIERPIESDKYQVSFFGEPAQLPVTYVQLALKMKVPVFVIAGQMKPDGSYLIDASEELVMQPHPDHHQEIITNAEKILSRLEQLICAHPDQWLMFYPVWPQALEQMP